MESPKGIASNGRATGYIRSIQASADADAALVGMFFDELWRFAKSQIGEHLQHRVGPSDIANAALRSALSDVRKKGAEEWSTERFRRLAKKIAEHKIRDHADSQSTQKRDVTREKDVFAGQMGVAEAERDDPAERVAARELAVLWASRTFAEVATGEMASQKRLVAALTVGSYRPKEIHEILKLSLPSEGEEVAPSLRLVELVAEKVRTVFGAFVDEQTGDVGGRVR